MPQTLDLSFIEEIVINYLKAHPEVVQRLIETLLNQVIAGLGTPTPKQGEPS